MLKFTGACNSNKITMNVSFINLIEFLSKQNEISKAPLPECEAVVNLAGENILNPLKR